MSGGGDLWEAIRGAQRVADFDTVERLARELAERCSAEGDVAGEGDAYAYLGGALVGRNEGPGARAAFQWSRGLYERTGDRAGIVRAINGLAVVAMDLELNLGEARWLIDEALSMARLTGDERLLGVVLGNLCEVRRYEGHYRRAIRSAREALAIMEATGDAPRAAWQLVTIAHCQFLQRERKAALASMRQAYEFLEGATYDARVVAWYFEVWFIFAAEFEEWELAARLLGFIEELRRTRNIVRLQLLLPWISKPTEKLWRRITEEAVHALMQEGAALTMIEADGLTRALENRPDI